VAQGVRRPGATTHDGLIFNDEASIANVPVPFLTINSVAPTIMAFGTEEQKKFFLPKIAAGDLHFAIGYSEPGAGTDLAALRTTAVRDGDDSRPRAVWLPHYPYPLARLLPGNRRMQIYVTVHDAFICCPAASADKAGPAACMHARCWLPTPGHVTESSPPSEATAARLKAIVRSAQVMVTPIPVDDIWFEPADRSLSPLRGPYLLYVGNTKRHKNLPLLLEAFFDISHNIPHKLVIAGGGASLRTLDERVRRLAEDNPDRVLLTGQLTSQRCVRWSRRRTCSSCRPCTKVPDCRRWRPWPHTRPFSRRTSRSCGKRAGDGADFFDPHDRDGLATRDATYSTDDAASAALAARGFSHVVKRQQRICATAAADRICAGLARSRT